MKPLFVSYSGHKNGSSAEGWVVIPNHPPLVTTADVSALVDLIASQRNYDPATLVLVNFRRLEDPEAAQCPAATDAKTTGPETPR
jgi:hypothetical protein